MARTPSISAQEAESALGARGSIQVDSNNRAMVRKWLTAQGFPSLFVGALSMTELALAYNRTDGSGLDRIRAKLAETRATFGDDDETDSKGSDDTAAKATDSATESRRESNSRTLEGLIRDIAADVAGRTVDAAAVRSIVREEIGQCPVTRIEITQADGTTHTVDGHKHPMLEVLIRAMNSRQANGKHPNIMLVGPTGSGKTHGVEQASKALGKAFYSNGAISMDHQLIGFKDANGNYHSTALREAFGTPATYLFDEIDSSDNSPLLCLAGALANGAFRFPDVLVERHPDSNIIAAANTWGLGGTSDFVGRNKLDGAIRSRFPVRIFWDYDEALERAICGNVDWACRVQKARANAKRAGLKVIIDPRMSQAGAALVASGMSFDLAASLTYLADLSAEQRKIVEAE